MSGQIHPLQAAARVAQSHEDKAVQTLAEARQRMLEQQKRVEQLVIFRSSYATLFQTESGSGMSARRFQDFAVFLNSLDQGIAQSQRQLERLREELRHQQQAWGQARAKTKALEEVIARDRQAQARLDDHRQQQDNDERNLRQQATRLRLLDGEGA